MTRLRQGWPRSRRECGRRASAPRRAREINPPGRPMNSCARGRTRARTTQTLRVVEGECLARGDEPVTCGFAATSAPATTATRTAAKAITAVGDHWRIPAPAAESAATVWRRSSGEGTAIQLTAPSAALTLAMIAPPSAIDTNGSAQGCSRRVLLTIKTKLIVSYIGTGPVSAVFPQTGNNPRRHGANETDSIVSSLRSERDRSKQRTEVRTMSTIGFVGLGSMGAPIAGRLLQGNAA